MYNIVIVEDDENIREELKLLLNNNGYKAEYITDFINASENILKMQPDMVLLDVNLPGISGLTICDQIRQKSKLPIIFVTSNRTSMDELNCIMRGGDDYVAKPYQIPLLLARIANIFRRVASNIESENQSEVEIMCGKVTLNIAGAFIVSENKSAELTKNELKILYYLMSNKGKYMSRTDIVDYLWDNEVFIDDNTLSVNVTRLRGKLSDIGVSDYIETKRGMGYRICG